MQGITNCECPLSGYCKRHNIIKTQHWHYLCQTHQLYFQKWEAGAGPGQKTDKNVIENRRIRLIAGQEHWLSIHSYPFSVPNWHAPDARYYYREWLKGIPSYGCSCKESWKKLTTKYPPIFRDRYLFFFWTVDRHNDVNMKLKKPIANYVSAVQQYNVPTPIPEYVRNSLVTMRQEHTRDTNSMYSLFDLP